jgi:hypothetical protein
MAKGRKTGGRKKGTPNKRQDLQEFLDAIFERVDLVQVAIKLLKGKAPSERILIRLLEYCYGRPPLGAEAEITMPKIINVSVMRRRPSRPRPPSEPYSSAATNPIPSSNKEHPFTSEPGPTVQDSLTRRPDIPLVRKRVFEAPT